MDVFVFVGPTLPADEAVAGSDVIFLPPAAQGDVFRAAKERPFAIGIVDGYFERLPAVWHKEILWAMSQGIHVFGAASMGALRAAELSAFGMKGVGKIFDAFSCGDLEDDDEVAVAHGDASTGYRAVSDAMVNIRATLRAAEQGGVITSPVAKEIERLAKAMFYPDRSYGSVLAQAAEVGVPAAELDALRSFVATNRVDQKRLDALALLDAVRQCRKAGIAPDPSTFTFAHTDAWDQVVDWAESQPSLLPGSDGVGGDLLAAEVRLLGARGRTILASTFNRIAAGELAPRAVSADHKERVEKIDQIMRRESQQKTSEGDPAARFAVWLREEGLSTAGYPRFVEQSANVSWFRNRYCGDLARHVVDELRVSGEYQLLSERAQHKQRWLADAGLESPTLKDAGVDAQALLSWYFVERLGRPVPVDLQMGLAELGIADQGMLETEALREFLYSRRP